MKSTHEEFIKFPDGGNAFITGVPDKCDHDFSLQVFEFANGDIIFEQDHRCPTNEATYQYIDKIAQDRNTHISGGTTACKWCKKLFTWIDIQNLEFQ